jgi:hypothetical protein
VKYSSVKWHCTWESEAGPCCTLLMRMELLSASTVLGASSGVFTAATPGCWPYCSPTALYFYGLNLCLSLYTHTPQELRTMASSVSVSVSGIIHLPFLLPFFFDSFLSSLFSLSSFNLKIWLLSHHFRFIYCFPR